MKYLFAACLLACASAHAADLTIQIDAIRSAEGSVSVSLFGSADAFLKTPLQLVRVKAEKGSLTVQLKDLAPGDYAFSVYHDANDNGKLDRNALGIPLEDYAASNNAIGNMGPPAYADARFALPAGGLDMRVKLH
jgi:uncharacterized protein (DUF2141 family)